VTLAGVCSALSVTLTLAVVRLPPSPATDPSMDVLVSRHALSLAGPLVAFASQDRHHVKPWFHGKVDFAPAVRDLSAMGFVLEGARLERLDGRAAAAVVYRIRNHPINLFVWRATAPRQPSGIALSQVRGYAVAQWSEQELMFAAVSDVDPRDLERFARAFTPHP
jgi:anti-sigma factor RsiW